jgi:hypothetical protein
MEPIMSYTLRRSAYVTAFAVVTAMAPEVGSSQSRATLDSMTGVWCGSARIVVNWTVEKKLGVSLAIAPSGDVTGQIGDAQLVTGRLKTNRGAVGRMLNIKTDYIVVGKLQGPIIASEKITRSSVKMPLNWTGSEFRGGVGTDGSSFGGKERMVLAAQGLVLRRWIVPASRQIGACE